MANEKLIKNLEQTYINFIAEEELEKFYKDKENDNNFKLLVDYKLSDHETLFEFSFGDPVFKEKVTIKEVDLKKNNTIKKQNRVF